MLAGPFLVGTFARADSGRRLNAAATAMVPTLPTPLLEGFRDSVLFPLR